MNSPRISVTTSAVRPSASTATSRINHVRVRGAPKVFFHLMFGILVVTVEQIMRLVT